MTAAVAASLGNGRGVRGGPNTADEGRLGRGGGAARVKPKETPEVTDDRGNDVTNDEEGAGAGAGKGDGAEPAPDRAAPTNGEALGDGNHVGAGGEP